MSWNKILVAIDLSLKSRSDASKQLATKPTN